MMVHQSTENLDVNILFDEITLLLDPEIRNVVGKGLHENRSATIHSGS